MKSKLIVCTLLAVGLLVAGARAQENVEARIKRIENGLIPAAWLKDDPQSMPLAGRMARYNVPGLSVAVINDGKVEWARGYGVVEQGGQAVTADTLFQAGSVSKPVAVLAAMRLVEQGRLALDDDVNEKLTSWKVPENDFTRERKVTLRRIVSHNAGLTVHGFPGYVVGTPVPTLVQILNGEQPANTAAVRVDVLPGSLNRYSGGGLTVMQQLLIDVTGKSFPDLMNELILGPTGMQHSTYEQPIPTAMAPFTATGHVYRGSPTIAAVPGRWHIYPEMAAAGLWTTPSDLARCAIEVQRALAGQSACISQATAQEMLKTQSGAFGLGFSLHKPGEPSARFSHGGRDEGFDTILLAYANTGQGAVVMMNGSSPEVGNELVRAIAQEYQWPDYPLPSR